MKVWGSWKLLSEREEEMLHETTLQILSEIGVKVESDEVLARLADFGAQVDRTKQVAFSRESSLKIFSLRRSGLIGTALNLMSAAAHQFTSATTLTLRRMNFVP